MEANSGNMSSRRMARQRGQFMDFRGGGNNATRRTSGSARLWSRQDAGPSIRLPQTNVRVEMRPDERLQMQQVTERTGQVAPSQKPMRKLHIQEQLSSEVHSQPHYQHRTQEQSRPQNRQNEGTSGFRQHLLHNQRRTRTSQGQGSTQVSMQIPTRNSATEPGAPMRRIPAREVMKLAKPEEDIEKIEFGLIEELDMHARHPQPKRSANRDGEKRREAQDVDKTSTEQEKSTAKNKLSKLRLRMTSRTNKKDEQESSIPSSPFLKSVVVEKRPLSATASEATAVATTGLGNVNLGRVTLREADKNKPDKPEVTKLEPGMPSEKSTAKKALPKFGGIKKEKSRKVGPTMIVSQGSRLRSNIGLGIAVTLTVLVGGVVGAFLYLAFFQ